MSLTSYRAAPPRGCLVWGRVLAFGGVSGGRLSPPRGPVAAASSRRGSRPRRRILALRDLSRALVRPPGASAVGDRPCAPPVSVLGGRVRSLVCRPGGDLLSHALRRSTIGAEGFHGRVRDGIGWGALAMATRSTNQRTGIGGSGIRARASPRVFPDHPIPALSLSSCRVRREPDTCFPISDSRLLSLSIRMEIFRALSSH